MQKITAAGLGLLLVGISYGGVLIYHRWLKNEAELHALTQKILEISRNPPNALSPVPSEALVTALAKKPDLGDPVEKWGPEWQRWLAKYLANTTSSANPPPHRPLKP